MGSGLISPCACADTEVAAARSLLGSYYDPDDVELTELAVQFAAARPLARAPRTIAKHAGPWKDFCEWVARRNTHYDIFAVPGEVVAAYLTHVSLTSFADGVGASRVKEASAAIACHYALYGLQSPTVHPSCKVVRETAMRTLRGKPLDRDAVTADDMRLMLDAFGNEHSSLMHYMRSTVFLLMYAGGLRFDEAAEISVHEDLMVFQDDHVQLFIVKSKTDQYLHGRWVVIAASGTQYCPVARLRRLLQMGGYVTKPRSLSEDVGPLLRAVSPDGQRLRQVVGTLSAPVPSLGDSRLREQCREFFLAVGVDKHITLHSFRIGSTTDAANRGAEDTCLRRFGNWASASMTTLYARATIHKMIEFSRRLAL